MCLPTVSPVMAVDAEALLKCLDYSFTETIYVRVVGSGQLEVDMEL